MNRKEGWRKEAGENVSQNESKVRNLLRFPGQSKLEVCLALAGTDNSGDARPSDKWGGGGGAGGGAVIQTLS